MADNTFNLSYTSARDDVLRMLPENARFVLDVGCSNGELGTSIKSLIGAQVHGIEIMPEMARVAASRLDNVFTGGVEEAFHSESITAHRYDVIIFADVLEHLIDPWAILSKATELLSPGGCIIASLPNIRHISTLNNLIWKGYWPYRDRGIHDRTHLRFFTKKNILELFKQADLKIELIKTNYRIIEKPTRLNAVARFFAWPGLRNFLAYQYLVRGRLKN